METESPKKPRRFNEEVEHEEKLKRAKTATDVQRLRLEKLLQNVDKPVVIPQPKKEWNPPPPPEFVRNVVGSSAGAGSGEYHIYRNLRKREYARQRFIQEQNLKEELDKKFEETVEQKRQALEDKTAKKRAKRQKKKMKARQKAQNKQKNNDQKSDNDSSDNDDSEADDGKVDDKEPGDTDKTVAQQPPDALTETSTADSGVDK